MFIEFLLLLSLSLVHLVKEESVNKRSNDSKGTTKTQHHERRKSSSSEHLIGHQRKVSDKKEPSQSLQSRMFLSRICLH
jgi:hypothetical protein